MKAQIITVPLAIIVLLVGCTKNTETKKVVDKDVPNYDGIEIPSVIKKEIKEGDGKVAQLGTTVKVFFSGWIYDPAKPGNKGKKFAEVSSNSKPFEIQLGEGQVISGWENSIVGMKENGKRQLIIPAKDAYGKDGGGENVPPDSILLIEVSLMSVE